MVLVQCTISLCPLSFYKDATKSLEKFQSYALDNFIKGKHAKSKRDRVMVLKYCTFLNVLYHFMKFQQNPLNSFIGSYAPNKRVTDGRTEGRTDGDHYHIRHSAGKTNRFQIRCLKSYIYRERTTRDPKPHTGVLVLCPGQENLIKGND